MARLRPAPRPGRPAGTRGVALLIVLMLTLILLVLGQTAMLLLDNVAQRSGTYRRTEVGNYCAEEGLNLARAWLLRTMGASTQIPVQVLNATGQTSSVSLPSAQNGFLADPMEYGSLAARDLCVFPGGNVGTPPVSVPAVVCRTDPSTGLPLYRLNLIDDIDEPTGSKIDPFTDHNNVFLLRSECLASTSVNKKNNLTYQNVAMIEVNQAGASSCYGNSAGPSASGSNSAGCGGGYTN